MYKSRVPVIAVAVIVGVSLGYEPTVFAQTSDAAASTPKQIRKAQRKATRVKKNADLKQLQENSYQHGGPLSDGQEAK